MTWLKAVSVGLILLASGPISATLPVTVDGQALPSLAPMLEKTTPAVVNISTRGKIRVQNELFQDPIFQRFFNFPGIQREQETQSLGSGVIVDAKNGYILTNNHVIEDAYEITVTLSDGRELLAETLGRDPDTDVAVIKVRSDNLQSLNFADSSRLRVGDFVVAIGNPFGLGQTVTSGIISALGRSGLGIESFEDFIQTDASINLGNSGGALVNLRGELIGINTAILGSGDGSSGSIGIGFAIPINMAQNIMQQLIESGEVKRGRLGIKTQDLSASLARAFNIKTTYGAVVTQIEQGSPAQKTGLMVGDVILKANGEAIRSSRDMYNLVGLMRVDQKVELEIIRKARKMMLTATIKQIEVPTIHGDKIHFRLGGAKIGEIKEADINQGMIEYLEVVEVKPGSVAWSTGLREGDIIHSLNKQRVTNFDEAYVAAKGSRALLINFQRGEQAMYILVK